MNTSPYENKQVSLKHAERGTQKQPSKSIDELRSLKESFNLTAVERQVAQGKKAIWGGLSWEVPLIYACDTIPVGIAELWRNDSKTAESVAENYFQIPGEFCSMIKAMSGRMHLRAPDPINKIIYFGSTCEPISAVFELAKKDNYDVFCIENVTTFRTEDKRPEVISFLAKELERASLWLNDGKPVDEDKIWFQIKRKNLVSQKIRKILDLRLKAPLYLKSVPTMQLLQGSTHYFGDPERYTALLDQLIDELTEAAKTPEERHFIPVVLAGGGAGSLEMLEIIEESGGAVLGWLVADVNDYRMDVPPLESIAHYVLDAQSRGELGEGAGTSATYRRFLAEKLINKTGAKGIISSAITGCPYGSVVQKTERDYFKGLDIPVISVETNVHKERPSEEQIMRVKTFVEMLS